MWFLYFTGACVIVLTIYKILRSPFIQPRFTYSFDMSWQPKIEEAVDGFLTDGGFKQIQEWQQIVDDWESSSLEKIKRGPFMKLRMRQFGVAAAKKPFTFNICMGTSFGTVIQSASFSYVELLERCENL